VILSQGGGHPGDVGIFYSQTGRKKNPFLLKTGAGKEWDKKTTGGKKNSQRRVKKCQETAKEEEAAGHGLTQSHGKE